MDTNQQPVDVDGMKQRSSEIASTPVNILIVDDHPENVVALRALLMSEDYRVVDATSGENALRILLREDFALVLLDVRMPEMDGFEVATMMRRRDRTRSVPILFLTGEALDSASMYKGYIAGAVDYLLKPLDPAVVRAKVAVFAELHRQKQQIRHQAAELIEAERKASELVLTQLKLENEHREKKLLEEALRIRDEFIALASHELRTPLSPLLGNLQALQRMADEGKFTPERVTKSLKMAIGQVHRIAHLVDELLEVTRVKAEKLSLSVEEVDLAQITRDVVEHYAEEAAKCGSEIRFSTQESVIGEWDRKRLEQVVTNLVTNAIKFGAGQPIDAAVSATPEDEENGECAQRGWARLEVRDRGIGIAPEDIPRIFNRFERAVPIHNYGGLGLGLYIVRAIIDAHGGTIRVDSTPGSGTTFTVDLPRHRVSAASRQVGPWITGEQSGST